MGLSRVITPRGGAKNVKKNLLILKIRGGGFSTRLAKHGITPKYFLTISDFMKTYAYLKRKKITVIYMRTNICKR